jgi:hypothetical protein
MRATAILIAMNLSLAAMAATPPAPRHIDEFNRIELQRLHVRVIPGQSLRVTDEMRIDVDAPYGFVARLNPKAHIESVRWNGRTSKFAFGGALLWVPVKQHARGKLTIRYRIDGIGDFLRSDDYWHPFFDFDSTNDRAMFVIDVTIPRAFELTTSLPQHERIDGANRIILAASDSPTNALTLAYARDWQGWNMDAGGFTVQLFTSDALTPKPAEILAIYRDTVQLLRDRFDVPPVAYFGVARIGAHFVSNSVVFINDDDPRAFLSGEIARRYVFGTGPETKLLQDGWAAYVESLFLRSRAGDASIFHKLEGALGQPRFDRAMRRFIHNCASKPQSMEDFLALMQGEAPPDFDVAAFLKR